MDDMHFNSTRIAGTDRLDSSDVEVSFHVSEEFARSVAAWQASHRVFVEEEDVSTGSMQYRMSSIPPPKLRYAYTESKRQLRVWVERKMPLSSSHGGRRFILAFVLGKDEVVRTRPFLVFAKKAKEGVGSKFKYQPVFLEVDARRAGVLQRLQDAFGAQEGRAAWEEGLATANHGEGKVVVPAHPLARALGQHHGNGNGNGNNSSGTLKRQHAAESGRALRSSGVAPASPHREVVEAAAAPYKRAKVTSSDSETTPPSVTALDMPNSEKWLLENDLADVYGADTTSCAAPGTGMRLCPSAASSPASPSSARSSSPSSTSSCCGAVIEDGNKLKHLSGGDAASEDAFGGLLDDFDCDLCTPMVEKLFEQEADEDIAAFCSEGVEESSDALDFDRLFAKF